MSNMSWSNVGKLSPRSYTCGHCGNLISSDKGISYGGSARRIYLCTHCDKPTYFESDRQIMPGETHGKDVNHIPDSVDSLYKEARICISVSANTSAVLACRKLLMNLAVSKGASEGKRFIEYVEYLSENGYIPPNGKGWVDHIRKKGNEATHEIAIMDSSDAIDLISFIEMLLIFIYEFPNRIPSHTDS